MKDENPIQPGDHTKIKGDQEDSTLSIRSTREFDAGNYTCIAKNAFGSDSFTTRLVIQGKICASGPMPHKESLFPSTSTRELDPKAKRRSNRTGLSSGSHLFCLGTPQSKHNVAKTPRYFLAVQSAPMTSFTPIADHSEDVLPITGSVMRMQSVHESDAGSYSCQAANGIGKELLHRFSIIVKGTRLIP